MVWKNSVGQEGIQRIHFLLPVIPNEREESFKGFPAALEMTGFCAAKVCCIAHIFPLSISFLKISRQRKEMLLSRSFFPDC